MNKPNFKDINPLDFEQAMGAIKKSVEKSPEDYMNEVPDEVLAEMSVRSNWSKISDEVKEKIIKGLPY